MRYMGATVLISEYTAPDDFEVVWQKEATVSMAAHTNSGKALEKLFKFKSRG